MQHRRRGPLARRVGPALIASLALLLQVVPAGLAAPSGTVSGVLEIEGARTADAVAVVTILDQGAGATEPLIIGQQRGPAEGAGPLPFAVRYDPTRIDPERPYVLYATVVDGDAVLQSTMPVPVITGGPETDVAVPMAVRPDGSATLEVTVTKKDKTSLGDAAVVQVGVVKVGSGRIAARDVSVAPGQVPVALSIPYDPALVDPTAQYLAKAAIVDGATVWESLVPVEIVPGSTDVVTIDVSKLPTSIPTITPSPGPSASPPPTAGPTEEPTPTPTPTLEPTAEPTATPSPTPTPTAAPSASAAPTPTAGPVKGTVSGTLTYREPAKLSGAARAIVALVDEGNGPSVAVLASEVIPTPGQQPIAFSLTYKTADINPKRTYTIRAAIADGDNAWISAKGVSVITGGAPSSGVVVPLTYRPDLLLGEVTGTLTGVDEPLGDAASSVTLVYQPETGAVLGFDARLQAGATSPIPFGVAFNVADVDPAATYVVTGEITDGEATWETTTPPRVITGGNPLTGIEVPLAAVATPTPSPSPTPSPAATPPPVPEPDQGDSGGGFPWWLLILVAIIVAGGIGAYLYMQRDSTPPPTDTPPDAAGTPPGAAAAAGAGAAAGQGAGQEAGDDVGDGSTAAAAAAAGEAEAATDAAGAAGSAAAGGAEAFDAANAAGAAAAGGAEAATDAANAAGAAAAGGAEAATESTVPTDGVEEPETPPARDQA